MSRKLYILLILLNTLLITAYNSKAQEFGIRKGEPITCYTSGKIVDPSDYILASKGFLENRNNARTSGTNSTIEMNLSGFPPEAVDAMQFAADIWSSLITSPIPIKITASWTPLGSGGVLANASSTSDLVNFEGSPQPGFWYPIALAEKIARREFNSPNASEISININSDNIGWYFGIDGAPPGLNDLVTVILHEIGHGLGFKSGNFATNCFSNPSIYNYFIHNGSGQQLVDGLSFPGNLCSQGGSDAIKNELISNDLFFKIPGGSIIGQLYAPDPFNPGSSISHLDENIYPTGNVNQLMTPFLNGVIHDPGPVAMRIFAEMGWVYTYFDHVPFADMELLNQPFQVTINSDTALIRNKILLHYSTDNFTTENTVILPETSNPDEYASSLSVGTNIDLSYYFSVVDTLGRQFNYPTNAPDEFITFFIGEDLESPIISHNPLNLILTTSSSELITAEISDNIGVSTAIVEYSINNIDQIPIDLTLNPEVDNQYLGSLVLPVGLIKGDVIEYRIVVTDASSNANQAFLPASGFFEVVINEFDAVNFYINDFDNTTNDFIGNEFTIDTQVGFVNSSIQSPHPYPDGMGPNLESNLIYQLAIPIIVDGDHPEMTFDEVVLVEPGDSASVFGEENFKDYVIVEGTNDNGANWAPLLQGYDSREYFEWLDKYNSIPKGVNSGANGNRLLFETRTIDLTETFNAGESIFIRFRLYSNSVGYGWGWAIDELRIQEEIVGFEGFFIDNDQINIFPNPANGQIYIEMNGLIPTESVDIEIFNTLGKSVYRKSINQTYSESLIDTANLSNLEGGLYLVNIIIGERQVSRKVLLK